MYIIISKMYFFGFVTKTACNHLHNKCRQCHYQNEVTVMLAIDSVYRLSC